MQQQYNSIEDGFGAASMHFGLYSFQRSDRSIRAFATRVSSMWQSILWCYTRLSALGPELLVSRADFCGGLLLAEHSSSDRPRQQKCLHGSILVASKMLLPRSGGHRA